MEHVKSNVTKLATQYVEDLSSIRDMLDVHYLVDTRTKPEYRIRMTLQPFETTN